MCPCVYSVWVRESQCKCLCSLCTKYVVGYYSDTYLNAYSSVFVYFIFVICEYSQVHITVYSVISDKSLNLVITDISSLTMAFHCFLFILVICSFPPEVKLSFIISVCVRGPLGSFSLQECKWQMWRQCERCALGGSGRKCERRDWKCSRNECLKLLTEEVQ